MLSLISLIGLNAGDKEIIRTPYFSHPRFNLSKKKNTIKLVAVQSSVLAM